MYLVERGWYSPWQLCTRQVRKHYRQVSITFWEQQAAPSRPRLPRGQAQRNQGQAHQEGQARHERQLGDQEQVQHPALWSINAAASTTEHCYCESFRLPLRQGQVAEVSSNHKHGVTSHHVSLAPFVSLSALGLWASGDGFECIGV